MKILTATDRSQGARYGDFASCIEGELMWAPEPCDDSWTHGGGPSCGCERAFTGLASHRSTTTAMVRDVRGLTPALLAGILRASLADQGWPPDWADHEADDLIRIAAGLEEGDVVERHLDHVGRRFHPESGRLLAPLPRRR